MEGYYVTHTHLDDVTKPDNGHM